MTIVKNILMVVYLAVAFGVIILALIQAKEDPGLEATITTASSNNYASKNKTTTQEGKQKRILIWLSVVFVVLTIVFGIVYMI